MKTMNENEIYEILDLTEEIQKEMFDYIDFFKDEPRMKNIKHDDMAITFLITKIAQLQKQIDSIRKNGAGCFNNLAHLIE